MDVETFLRVWTARRPDILDREKAFFANFKFPIASIVKFDNDTHVNITGKGLYDNDYGSVLLSVVDWCKENCTKQYAVLRSGYFFAFEDVADATMFKLRWG